VRVQHATVRELAAEEFDAGRMVEAVITALANLRISTD